MAFKALSVKEWKPWMTECVILFNAGTAIPDLSIKYSLTNEHIANILRSEKAKEITKKTAEHILEQTIEESQPKIKLIISKALDEMLSMVGDRILKEAAPLSYWEQLRKTVDTLAKLNDPSLTIPQQNISIQQNIQNVLSAGPDVLKRLREGAMLPQLNVTENVEYLGSPPPRESAGELYAGRVDSVESKGQNGLTLSGPISSDAAGPRNRRFPF